ncbi:RHS repeat-associated protein [Alteromonadaceae bacterium 2753L.S.0a.02]|nr:RHS repeat-associated protein [Alteromonadaceae bacterium 2753L.S.0a.02]
MYINRNLLILFLTVTALCHPYQRAQAEPELYFVHSDHLNTPQMLTDQNGNVVWQVQSQTPFGVVETNEDVDGDGQAIEFNLRFPGQYYDGETGLSYNYFRDYDPLLGRYVQSDPIGLEGGINTYGYVLGNPINSTDPLGLRCWTNSDGNRQCDSGNPYGDRPFCPDGSCTAYDPDSNTQEPPNLGPKCQVNDVGGVDCRPDPGDENLSCEDRARKAFNTCKTNAITFGVACTTVAGYLLRSPSIGTPASGSCAYGTYDFDRTCEKKLQDDLRVCNHDENCSI